MYKTEFAPALVASRRPPRLPGQESERGSFYMYDQTRRASMAGWGDYNSYVAKYTPLAHDEGERRVIGRADAPPPVDWGRAYGDDGRTLAQEAAALLAEGYAPDDAAQELVLRYGRQVEATVEELVVAANAQE